MVKIDFSFYICTPLRIPFIPSLHMEDSKTVSIYIKLLRNMVWVSDINCNFVSQSSVEQSAIFFRLSSMTIFLKLSGIEAPMLDR